MKFNFRKIMSIAATAVMLGSTVAAASYPAPFVSGGTAAGAVVVGANAATSDWQAAIDLQTNLNGQVTSTTTSSSGTVTGEAYPLFTSSSTGRIYYNDSIGKVRTGVTSTELPTTLKSGNFEGDVSATFTQRIDILSNANTLSDGVNLITYAQQPTTSVDPQIGIVLGTTVGKALYNYTVTFNKGVNFTHADSKKQTLVMGGQEYTVSSATSATKGIVLFKSSETLDLSIGGTAPNPSQKVTVGGKEYTIELKSGTDSSATIKVTDSTGASDTKEVTEGNSKKIQGIEVAVNLADESTATNSVSAEVTVGADKVVLKTGASVKQGSDESSISGTLVTFSGNGNAADALTKIAVTVWEHDGNADAILEGKSFVDPVFGTFKVDFTGVSSPLSSTTSRELITVTPSTDKASVKFTNHKGVEKSIDFLNNETSTTHTQTLADSNEYDYNIAEMARVNESEYVFLGNEDNGYLMKLETVENDSSGTTPNADVVLKDVFSGTEYTATITSDHDGEIYIGGNKFTVYYTDEDAKSGEEYARFNSGDSPTAGSQMVVYPTIQTGKGAHLFFYAPVNVTLQSAGGVSIGLTGAPNGWDGLGNNLSKFYFPDGDGYTTVTLAAAGGNQGCAGNGNWSVDGTNGTFVGQGTEPTNSTSFTIGKLTYNLTASGMNATTIKLVDTVNSANINVPAIVIFEEEDDNTNYHAEIIKMAGSGTSTVPVTVTDVLSTYDGKGLADHIQGETNDKLYTHMDLWGTLSTVDKSDTDQYTASLSYPDNQIYAQVYVGEDTAAITPSTDTSTGSGGNVIVVKDSEVDSVKDKNLIVVGGSCINTVAAKILDSTVPLCGADFSAKTNTAAGQWLIKTVASPYNADKVAMLVAGYNYDDTQDAIGTVKAGVTTDKGTSQVYPIATA